MISIEQIVAALLQQFGEEGVFIPNSDIDKDYSKYSLALEMYEDRQGVYLYLAKNEELEEVAE